LAHYEPGFDPQVGDEPQKQRKGEKKK